MDCLEHHHHDLGVISELTCSMVTALSNSLVKHLWILTYFCISMGFALNTFWDSALVLQED